MRYYALAMVGGLLFGIGALLLKLFLGSPGTVLPLLMLAAGFSLGGFVLVQTSLRHKKTSHVMLVSNMAATVLPVVGGIALLHETVTLAEMTGIALIMAAVSVLLLRK